MWLNLEKIRIDGQTQSREIKEDVVAQYAEDMQRGDQFPDVVVFCDGEDNWLGDGFHRYFARKRVNSPNINAEVRDGTQRDAEWFGMGANSKHGYRASNADKRRMAIRILGDIEWQDKKDREIADHLNVSHTFINKLRQDLKEKKNLVNVYKSKNQASDKKEEEKQPDFVKEFSEAEVEREEMEAAVKKLQKDNEELQDQLTVAMAASADDIEKEKAQSMIKDLRAQIRLLEIELKAVTISRDQFQSENAQLMKQVQMLTKKLKKLESK